MGNSSGNLHHELLAELRKHRRPQSAYALLTQLRRDNPRLGPTTIYRALDSLIRKGSVRRLESIKSYVVCRHGGGADDCIVVICDDCGSVEECDAPGLIHELSAKAAKSGFAATRHVVEVHGRCNGCGAAGMAG